MPSMFHLLFLLLLISPSLSTPQPEPESDSNNKKYTSFIASSCRNTTYPTLCMKTCLPYAAKIHGNPKKLVVAALSATLTAAQSASTTVGEVSRRSNLEKYEAAAIGDCVENMRSSIDDLKQSIQEIDDFRASDDHMKFKISNIQTWMSAAITNEDTCMDGIRERRVDSEVKRKIRGCILGVAKLTSNALCLCNHIQY